MAVPSMRLIRAFYAAAFRGEVGLWEDGRMSGIGDLINL